MDILEKFKEYYTNHYDPSTEKILHNKDNKFPYYADSTDDKYLNDEIFNIQQKNINNYIIEHKYSMGIDINFNFNKIICYHKIQKWFAFIYDNKVIIEDFSEDENRKQTFLEDSKYKLTCIKISTNNNYLLSYSTNSFQIENNKNKDADYFNFSYNVFEEESFNNINSTINKINPYIFIWDCKDSSHLKPNFKNITKLSIKHNKIFDCEFSPQNNLCVFSSKFFLNFFNLGSNNFNENFVSVLDFLANEIIVTTLSTQENNIIKFNPYLRNLEFTTLSHKMFTFWRINLDASLQYQLGDFDKKKLEDSTNFTCLDYTPPLSNNATVLLLIGLSNLEIWGIDTKTNCLVIKYPSKYFFNFEKNNLSQIENTNNNNFEKINHTLNNINLNTSFRFIFCTFKYIILIYANIIKVFKFPYPLSDERYENFNIFTGKPSEMFVDSEIITFDLEIMDESDTAVCLTKKGNLWGINFSEITTLRIYSFQYELHGIDIDNEISYLETSIIFIKYS